MDVIRLVQPLLPDDPRLHVHHDDFADFSEMEGGKVRRDTVIWDLAVADTDEGVTEGKDIMFAGVIAHTRYSPQSKLVDMKTGKLVTNPHASPDFQVFTHGVDRDPVGAAFVKTEEFRRVHAIHATTSRRRRRARWRWG